MEQSGIPRVVIVAYAAGGAEIVLAWAQSHPEYNYSFVLEGPAASVADRRFAHPDIQPRGNLEVLVRQADWVLTETDSTTDLAFMALRAARKYGTRIVSYLDHWIDYRARFEQDGILFVPDEVWAGDEAAFKLARHELPEAKVVLEPNPYFAEMITYFQSHDVKRPTSERIRVLYLCEPTRTEGRFSVYNDQQAVRCFLDKLPSRLMGEGKQIETLKLRLHPSEESNRAASLKKYSHILSDYPAVSATYSDTANLAEDCLWADWVVGRSSVALVLSVLAGRKVFSAIPSDGYPHTLPFDQIQDW